MKRVIKSSEAVVASEEMSDVIDVLSNSIDEFDEYSILDAKVVNLGDGGSYLIIDDHVSGNVCGLEIDTHSTEVGFDDVVNRVKESWM